jgi:hypothetical protein
MKLDKPKKTFITPQQKIYFGGIFLFIGFFSMFFLPPDLFIGGGLLLVGSILLLAFLYNLKWGLYTLFGFSFFANWFIYLGNYQWFKNISYLAAINAPVVDFIALLLGGGLFLAWFLLIYPLRIERLKHIVPLIVLYGIFILVAAFSALHAYDRNVAASFKYLARPMIFAFLFFIMLPHLLIDTKETLIKLLKIWFWVGVGIAVFGLSSLLVVPQTGWWRVTPYTVDDIAPLGYNHNLIAEALVALIPIGIYFTFKAKGYKEKNWLLVYAGGTALMILAELLTLSRAGWITLTVQAIVLLSVFGYSFKNFFQKYKVNIMPVLILAGIILSYMVYFLTSSIVKDATVSRLTATEIVVFYVERSPWVGYGPGMFIPIFENTKDFIQEYGVALDGHGFIQKVVLEEGIVGLILFISVLIYILVYLWSAQRKKNTDPELSRLLFVMVVGAIIFQMFNTSYFISVMWLPLGVGLVAVKILEKKD